MAKFASCNRSAQIKQSFMIKARIDGSVSQSYERELELKVEHGNKVNT